MDIIVTKCEESLKKYGHIPFHKALPFLQEVWWEIGRKHGMTGPQVVEHYLDWKAKRK